MKVINKSQVLEILSSYNFWVIETKTLGKEFENYAFTYNDNIYKGIVVAEYENLEEFNNLTSDINQIRSRLKSIEYNVWNIYLFILIKNHKVKDRTIYNLERNSSDFRKYVILTQEDIYRVPFLKKDNEGINNLKFLSLKQDILNSNDCSVNELLRKMIKENGENNQLTDKKIKEIINQTVLGDSINEIKKKLRLLILGIIKEKTCLIYQNQLLFYMEIMAMEKARFLMR